MTEPPDDVVRRLQQSRICWLCTLRSDGSPHVTPVWFVFRDKTWWIGSDEHNRKVRNVVADPRVSTALEDGERPVVAEGRAVVHRDRFPTEIVDRFAAKYDGWDVRGDARVMLEIPVERWLLAGTAQ